MQYGPVIFATLGMQIPAFLVWLVGGILMIVRRKRHPRATVMVVIALVLAIIGMILSVASSILPLYMSDTLAIPYSQISIYMGVIAIVGTILRFGMWVLFFIALLIERKPAV